MAGWGCVQGRLLWVERPGRLHMATRPAACPHHTARTPPCTPQIAALLEVSTADWRPLSLRLCLAGEHELWSFADWREWQPGLWLAGAAVQTSSGDSPVVNEYAAGSVQLRAAGGDGARGSSAGAPSRFAQPPMPLMPQDAAFVPGLPADVPAWHTVSGHRCGCRCWHGRTKPLLSRLPCPAQCPRDPALQPTCRRPVCRTAPDLPRPARPPHPAAAWCARCSTAERLAGSFLTPALRALCWTLPRRMRWACPPLASCRWRPWWAASRRASGVRAGWLAVRARECRRPRG